MSYLTSMKIAMNENDGEALVASERLEALNIHAARSEASVIINLSGKHPVDVHKEVATAMKGMTVVVPGRGGVGNNGSLTTRSHFFLLLNRTK